MPEADDEVLAARLCRALKLGCALEVDLGAGGERERSGREKNDVPVGAEALEAPLRACPAEPGIAEPAGRLVDFDALLDRGPGALDRFELHRRVLLVVVAEGDLAGAPAQHRARLERRLARRLERGAVHDEERPRERGRRRGGGVLEEEALRAVLGLEAEVEALLLAESADEARVALPVLDDVLAGRVGLGRRDDDVRRGKAAPTQHLDDDVGHALVLEDARAPGELEHRDRRADLEPVAAAWLGVRRGDCRERRHNAGDDPLAEAVGEPNATRLADD